MLAGVNKKEKAKADFKDTLVYNILRLSDGWAKVSFHYNWNEAWLLLKCSYIPVASQVTKRRKT